MFKYCALIDIVSFLSLVDQFEKLDSLSVMPRPYFNHSIEFKKKVTREERIAALEKAGLNVFYFPSEMVTGCDLLSDSGTTKRHCSLNDCTARQGDCAC